MLKILVRFIRTIHTRNVALCETEKFLDKIKFNSCCRSIDDTIGYLIKNDILIQYKVF